MTNVTRSDSYLYSAFAFTSIVATCYAQYLFVRRIDGATWQVAASFLLGALYAVIGVLGDPCSKSPNAAVRIAYFSFQCALLTTLVFVTPVRGFFGLIVLPLVSEAIFHLNWKAAVAIGVYLFAITVGVFAYFYNLRAASEAAISYLAAFTFTVVFTIVTVRAVRARGYAEQLRTELETANAQLRAHAAAAEELATTRERNRLAREIHDGVGHYLTVVKVQLDAAHALLATDPQRAADSVAKASRLAGEALDDVRRSVGSLAADAARPPLAASLRQLALDGAPTVNFRIEGAARPIPSAAEHALFRTAQEGLTNLRKHAAAKNATLLLDFRAPAAVRLSLVDDGRGASATAPAGADGTGYGLRGLRERIALLGGTLQAGNRPEGGFALTAEVPA